MKRLLNLTVMVWFAIGGINAQILRADELENYAKEKYGDKWNEAAATLGAQLQLDKNNALTYTQVIEAPGKSAEQLYVLLNYWFTSTFNDADAVINLNDKDLGTIIAQGYVANIAGHTGGANSYSVNLKPIIKCDIKEERIRVTYTVPFYSVVKMAGGGALAALSGVRGTRIDENWTLDTCYPFAEKDSHKKTSSKALVMANAYSNVLMDKIEECVKGGMVGNEDEDW